MNPEIFLDGSTLAMLGEMTPFVLGLALLAARSRWQARRPERSTVGDPVRWNPGGPGRRASSPPVAEVPRKLAG